MVISEKLVSWTDSIQKVYQRRTGLSICYSRYFLMLRILHKALISAIDEEVGLS
jgi:hypothetical protein